MGYLRSIRRDCFGHLCADSATADLYLLFQKNSTSGLWTSYKVKSVGDIVTRVHLQQSCSTFHTTAFEILLKLYAYNKISKIARLKEVKYKQDLESEQVLVAGKKVGLG
jgi:hypothetical protein